MAKKRRRILKRSKRQVGRSLKAADLLRHALPPGKRRSKTGHIYYENRRNRSDMGRWI